MPLVEKIEQSDLILYEICRNPVLFTEFVANMDKGIYDEKFELTSYQKEFLCDFNSYVEFCCGRAVGKSEALSWLIIWLLIYNVFPQDYIVYTVPNRVHLEPVFTKLVRHFRSNSFLKNFIEPRGGIDSAQYTVKLLNQTNLICRIAGQSGGGGNVIGLHAPFIIVDEAGYYSWGTWIELQPTLNTWTTGYRMYVSGVPTGLRENNVLYFVDQVDSKFTKHRIPSILNPRFSEQDHIRAKDQYGGDESDDYIHLVLGQHGKPVFSLFDRSTMEVGNYPVYKLVLDGILIGDNIMEYLNKLTIFPGVPDKNSNVIFGIDLGYTEPTAILILYLDNYKRLRFHGRIQLNKVSYPIQERIIDLLDTKFNPSVIGMDKGSAGISVIQRLQEDHEFLHKDYKNRLVPVDFSSSITLGLDVDGSEIKEKTKPFATSILQDYCNNHKIVFSSTDLEMISELERMTYSKTPTGDIVYKTLTTKGGKRGDDHFTAALLCGILSYYMTSEFSLNNKTERKKLFKPSWFMGF